MDTIVVEDLDEREWRRYLMTAIDDLKASVVTLETEQRNISVLLGNLTAEIAILVVAVAAQDSAAIEQAVTDVNAVSAALAAAAAAVPPGDLPPVQAFDPASNLALYAFTGTGAIDLTAWTAAVDVTSSAGATLYTFSGDTPGAAPLGAQAGTWVPYVGLTSPVVTPPTGAQAFDPGTNMALYTWAGPVAPDPTVWTEVADVTGPASAPLYTYDLDTPGAAPTGAAAGGAPFTGTPVPATPPASF